MIDKQKRYCNNLTKYSRFKTREVFIGKIPLGGNNPIRIQSMTTTVTMDTIASYINRPKNAATAAIPL